MSVLNQSEKWIQLMYCLEILIISAFKTQVIEIFKANMLKMEKVLPEKKKDNTEKVLDTMINVEKFLKN